MAELAIQAGGNIVGADDATRKIREKLIAARAHRKKQEPSWQLSMAFALGGESQWSVWTTGQRGGGLRKIGDVDPRYADRELYTADITNEFRMHVLGELASDDDRMELLLAQDDPTAERFQAQANKALGYAWDVETEADEVLAQADRYCVDLGTSAIRAYFDKDAGSYRPDLVPHLNGEPQFGDAGTRLMAQYNEPDPLTGQPRGPIPGVTVEQIKSGKCCLEALSAFNLLVPPGIVDERKFPWEAVIRPVPLDEIRERFGPPAADLKEDKDIGSTLGAALIGARDAGSTLRDHAWLVDFYEQPTKQYPSGRVVYLAGNGFKPVGIDPALPYCVLDANGEPLEWRSGISYFHFWRVTGRFWSRGLIDALKDPQRGINLQRTLTKETIARGQPKVIADEGAPIAQTGLPLEVIRVGQATRPAQVMQGIAPGPYMKDEVEQLREDAEHSTGIRALALGENPSNVNTLGQLTLLKESESVKRQPVQRERARALREIHEHVVYDIKKYWGHEKQIVLAGEDDRIDAFLFDATKIPALFIIRPAKGTAKPRSQGAELTKIDQLWQAAQVAGVVQQNPQAWVDWYKESLEQGQALELPDMGGMDVHAMKAELENHKLREGDTANVIVADYDPISVHLPIHRDAQIKAEEAGEVATWQALSAHIADHERMEQEKQLQLRAQQAAVSPGEQQAQDAQAAAAAAPSNGGVPAQ